MVWNVAQKQLMVISKLGAALLTTLFTIAIVASLVAWPAVLRSEGTLSTTGWATVASDRSLLVLHPLWHRSLSAHAALVLLGRLLLVAIVLACATQSARSDAIGATVVGA